MNPKIVLRLNMKKMKRMGKVLHNAAEYPKIGYLNIERSAN